MTIRLANFLVFLIDNICIKKNGFRRYAEITAFRGGALFFTEQCMCSGVARAEIGKRGYIYILRPGDP
jgi:hypothetical protein